MAQKLSLNMETKVTYYFDGTIEGEIEMVNGKKLGTRKWYYTNGVIQEQYIVFVDGFIYGIQQSWNQDQTRDEISTVKADNQHGTRIQFEYGC